MRTYLLRDIDENDWRKFKSELALEGKSVKQALLEYIREYSYLERENDLSDFYDFVEGAKKENSRE